MKPFTKRLALVMGLLFMALSSFALFKPHDESNLREVNSEFSGQPAIPIGSRLVKLSDSAHLFPRKFHIAMPLATERDLSAFFIPVPIVVYLRSQEQMLRIGAGAIIAGVKDAQPCWYFSVVNEPRSAVSAARVKSTISVLVFASQPSPTESQSGTSRMGWPVLGNLRPESLLKGFGKSLGRCVSDGNCRVHSVSNVIVCRASGWFIAARGQLRLDSQVGEGFAI